LRIDRNSMRAWGAACDCPTPSRAEDPANVVRRSGRIWLDHRPNRIKAHVEVGVNRN
jgi:hypothetical protein